MGKVQNRANIGILVCFSFSIAIHLAILISVIENIGRKDRDDTGTQKNLALNLTFRSKSKDKPNTKPTIEQEQEQEQEQKVVTASHVTAKLKSNNIKVVESKTKTKEIDAPAPISDILTEDLSKNRYDYHPQISKKSAALITRRRAEQKRENPSTLNKNVHNNDGIAFGGAFNSYTIRINGKCFSSMGRQNIGDIPWLSLPKRCSGVKTEGEKLISTLRTSLRARYAK